MFKNFLKVAIRNIVRQKIYSLINILGLAIALLTVSIQAVNAALTNPAESLRYE